MIIFQRLTFLLCSTYPIGNKAMCRQPSFAVKKNFKTKSMRTKLWELDHIYHCAVIGTCLTLAEVKKILHALKINFNQYKAYDIHTNVVTLAGNNNFCSKKIQNYLDKKFSVAIKKTRKMDAFELKIEWSRVLKTGDFLGTFWALISHPETDEALRKIFYGDVHMLSHLSGASNRVDLKRLNQLEKEKIDLSQEYAHKEKKYTAIKCTEFQQTDKINLQEQLIASLKHETQSLKLKNSQLNQSNDSAQRVELIAQLDKQKNKLIAQENQLQKYRDNTHQLTEDIQCLKNQHAIFLSDIAVYKEEVNYLQYQLNQEPRNQCQFKKYNLCGQCVLYVGGKQNLIPHYRKLIEDQAGVFLHHDGGGERTTQNLSDSLSQADIVVFPSDCISHDAYWKIKRVCKKQKKPYKYINSAGLGSLFNTLKNMEQGKLIGQS